MINPLHRRGEKPSSSKTQLKETVQKKPIMSTNFNRPNSHLFSDQVQNDEESPEENQILRNSEERNPWKLKHANYFLPLNLSQECLYSFLHWRLGVYLTTMLLQLIISCSSWRTCTTNAYNGSQGDLSRWPKGDPDDPWLFRILSGSSRIQWEMGVSRYTPERTHKP